MIARNLRVALALGLGLSLALAGTAVSSVAAQQAKPAAGPQLVWVDTDIGDDIDDAFALGLILRSPELKVLGISTTYGDTETRARLVDRLLAATGEQGIPVTAGPRSQAKNPPTQQAYAGHFPARKHADGVTAMLTAIDTHPGQVTLIALGPLVTVGAAIAQDPAKFRKLKRVAMMGGSIYRGYGGEQGKPGPPPDAEWNVEEYPKGFGQLLEAGVPLYLMPLDSTQVPLEAADREALFGTGNAMTDQVTLLYHEWLAHKGDRDPVPTLYDPVAAAYTFRPDLCPATPMRLAVDEKGFTKPVEGKPNAEVCLKSDEKGFLDLLLTRLAR